MCSEALYNKIYTIGNKIVKSHYNAQLENMRFMLIVAVHYNHNNVQLENNFKDKKKQKKTPGVVRENIKKTES